MDDRSKMRWLNLIFIIMMSAYVVFEHATDCETIDSTEQISRHELALAGESKFYNPWQYRIFPTIVLEGFIRTYKAVAPGTCDICPYLLLRVIQNVMIFYLCLFYYQKLGVRNPLLLLAGLLILCLTYGNSSFHSDLSFNTYFDIIFYLAAALLILNNKEIWILPLIVLASLNRETSALIPFMILAPFSLQKIDRRKILIAAGSFVLFLTVFVALRWMFEYRPAASIHGMSKPLEFLHYNITFVRLYPLLFGTLGFIPIIAILGLKRLPILFQHWFWLIVPIWFVIHLFYSLAVETRLFLAPHTLLFIPALLLLVERWHEDHFALSPLKKL